MHLGISPEVLSGAEGDEKFWLAGLAAVAMWAGEPVP